MKRILPLLLICSCTPEPKEKPEPVIQEPALPETRAPEPETNTDEDIKPEDREEGTRTIDEVVDVEEIMEMGVMKHELEEQLTDMHRLVAFVECIKKSTKNPKADFEVAERHLRKRTKYGRRCKKKVAGLTDEQLKKSADAWLEQKLKEG